MKLIHNAWSLSRSSVPAVDPLTTTARTRDLGIFQASRSQFFYSLSILWRIINGRQLFSYLIRSP